MYGKQKDQLTISLRCYIWPTFLFINELVGRNSTYAKGRQNSLEVTKNPVVD